MISSDADILISLIDQEAAFILGQQGAKRGIVLLPRFLDWLRREPRLSALLEDLHADEVVLAQQFRQQRAVIHQEAERLWREHGVRLQELLAGESTDPRLFAYGDFARFEERIGDEPEEIACRDCPLEDRYVTANRIAAALHHWVHWAQQKANDGRGDEPPEGLLESASRLKQVAHHVYRRFQVTCARLPSAALRRLDHVRSMLEVEPPAAEASEEEATRWVIEHLDDAKFSATVLSDSAQLYDDDGDAIEKAAQQLRQDVQLLHQELRHRVLLGWSRQAIVRRYAARCEAFDAERLREAAASSNRPEAVLTLDFARYLFDQGLTPLLDPKIGGLKPDVVDFTGRYAFYVEAKQYDEAHPRAKIRAAARQVWSTWAQLRKQHECTEAFLVVFRRSGPWVNLPAVVRTKGLSLHVVLVDLSTEAGSAEKRAPIEIHEQELLPSEES